MKKLPIILALFLCNIAFGQSTEKTKPAFNRWSIDIAGGPVKARRNFAPGYESSSQLLDWGELNIGGRYMFNAYFGMALKAGFTRIQDDNNSPEFATNMGRLGLEGVVNVGNALNFYEWTNRIGLLFHTGIGVGILRSEGFPFALNLPTDDDFDNVGIFTIGITPQVRLNNRVALNFDLSMNALARQTRTWDFTQEKLTAPLTDATMFNGHMLSATIGASIYLGKGGAHADWSPTKSVNKNDLDALAADMDKMRKGMNDDDKDGVPNYLDEEKDTPIGSLVNMKGVADASLIDTDKDGIADQFDACPEVMGKFSANGCPDKDNDGVADKDDKCPNEAGPMSNGGCPQVAPAPVTGANNSGMEILYFSINSAALTSAERAKLDKVHAYMVANPNAKLNVNGHADKTGEDRHNMNLSKNRAKMAKNYLVGKGIKSSRIDTDGFGSNRPVDTSGTMSGNSLNRRVEFEVK